MITVLRHVIEERLPVPVGEGRAPDPLEEAVFLLPDRAGNVLVRDDAGRFRRDAGIQEQQTVVFVLLQFREMGPQQGRDAVLLPVQDRFQLFPQGIILPQPVQFLLEGKDDLAAVLVFPAQQPAVRFIEVVVHFCQSVQELDPFGNELREHLVLLPEEQGRGGEGGCLDHPLAMIPYIGCQCCQYQQKDAEGNVFLLGERDSFSVYVVHLYKKNRSDEPGTY